MGTGRSIVIGIAITALSASAAAQKISYDYKRGADFSGLRTFSFRHTPPLDEVAAQTSLYDDPLVRERTQAAVARQLEARGLIRDDEHPDVLVTARRAFQTEYYVYGPNGWWGYGPYNWWSAGGYGYSYGAPWYGYPTIVGTLTVDVVRPDGELLWRGVSQTDVHPRAKPAERTERVNREVSKMFKKFPSTGAVATTGQAEPKPR